MKPQLLLDGDELLYKSTTVSEYEADYGNGVRVLSTNVEQARDAFQSMLTAITDELDHSDFVIVLSGDNTFRYELWPDYKPSRPRKPLGYFEMRDWVRETYPKVISHDCLEADDYMGILATMPNSVPRIIVSQDKDMQTIPGELYRQGELRTITEDEADRFWMFQTLTGDTTDGYKGCPGVGKVKAEAILAKPGAMWVNVLGAYLKAGLTEADALLNARLARILRFSDWDSAAKRPRLWTPDA